MNKSSKLKKESYFVYALLFVTILVLVGITISNAFFKVQTSTSTTPTNIAAVTECMDISYTEENTIGLDYNYPISDEFALKNVTPITVKVTNNCTSNQSKLPYTLAITSLSNSTGSISDDKVRTYITRAMGSNNHETFINTDYLNKLDMLYTGTVYTYLNADLDSKEGIDGYSNRVTYVIDSNSISNGETVTYDIYLWIDYYEGDAEVYNGAKHNESYDNTTQGLNFASAISLVTNPASEAELGTAFAIYSAEDSSLTFIRDSVAPVVGKEYNDNPITAVFSGFEEDEYTSGSSVPWTDYKTNIKKVIFEDEIIPISTAFWFASLRNCSSMNLENLNVSNVTNMRNMFTHAGYNAEEFDISDISNWNTSKVTNMRATFANVGYNAKKVNLGDLSNWDTGNVTDMSQMFYGTGFNADNVSLNLSNWDLSNVTTMNSMFREAGKNASKFILGDLSNWHTVNVRDMKALFYEAGYKAEEFYIGKLSNWNTINLNDASHMFYNAAYSANNFELDLSNWNTENISNIQSMFYRTGYKAKDFRLNLSGWNINGSASLEQILAYAGYTANNLELDLSNWNTSNITNISGIFNRIGYNSKNIIIDLSNWNTSSITNMSNLFYEAGYNSNVFIVKGMSDWNVSNVTNMNSMFHQTAYEASTFDIGDLSNWKTGNVTDMYRTFYGAGVNADYKLDLSRWNVSKVTSYAEFNVGVGGKVYSPKFGTTSSE